MLALSLATPARKTLAIWFVTLGSGAALLYARFDWNARGGHYAQIAGQTGSFAAKRDYLLSLYLFVIMLPTVFYLARRTLHSDRVATALTAVVFVFFTVPYRLLHLETLYYYATHPRVFVLAIDPVPADEGFRVVNWPAPKLEFLPGGHLLQFPWEWLFVPLLFAAGVACVRLVCWVRARAGFSVARHVPRLLTVAFALICVQMFLHAGMRAPYTYMSYFERPQQEHHWYIVYNFNNQTGATQADEQFYADNEDWFQGAPLYGQNALARRPFSFYIASQFTYFFNQMYVWLALNCLFWLAAVFATARLVTRLATPRAGVIAGALVVAGPGFVGFVSQLSEYVLLYAAAAIALCAFEDLVVSPSDGGPRRYVLFGGVLALCGLIYDLEPVFLALLAYGLARKLDWRRLVATLAGAFAVVYGYTLVLTKVLGVKIEPVNGEQLPNALRAVWHLLTHPSVPGWYDTFGSVVPTSLHLWLQAFFVIPPILALFGFRLLRDRATKVLVVSLFGFYFAAIAALQIGEQWVGKSPREVYPSFISVYLPAAVFLAAIAERARGFRFYRAALATRWSSARAFKLDRAALPTGRNAWLALHGAAPWIIIAVMFVLVNIDIFGYPTLYVEYFEGITPYFLPH